MLLRNHPETRDNDNTLLVKVWAEEKPEIKVKGYSLATFTLSFKRGEFSSSESVRRTRQKLQQEFPELRGKNYKERHNHEEVIKEQLTDGNFLKGGTP